MRPRATRLSSHNLSLNLHCLEGKQKLTDTSGDRTSRIRQDGIQSIFALSRHAKNELTQFLALGSQVSMSSLVVQRLVGVGTGALQHYVLLFSKSLQVSGTISVEFDFDRAVYKVGRYPAPQ